MATKRQIIELIETTEQMTNKCDSEVVRLIPGRMLSIFHSLEDREITDDDYRELVNRVRKLSEKFTNDCRCIGI